MLEYLKVKVLSLTEEAKIIRRLEYKHQWLARFSTKQERIEYHQKIYNGLHRHRVFDVREETRSSHLAYGFLKGNTYFDMEAWAEKEPNWEKIQRLVMRYGEGDPSLLKLSIEIWIKNAKEEWFVNNLLLISKNKERVEKRKAKQNEQVLDSV